MTDTAQDKASDTGRTASAKDGIDEAARPKLGLSKAIYGLGMSARDGLVTLAASTAGIWTALYFGGKKFSFLERIAKIPEVIGSRAADSLGPRFREMKNAFVVAFGAASIIEFFAHMPGLVRGPKKIAEAERRFDRQVELREQLSEAYRLQEAEIERLKKALDGKTAPTMTGRLEAEPAAATARGM